MPAKDLCVDQSHEGLRIVIPAESNVATLIFYLFWLLGWAAGEIVALQQILFGDPTPFIFAWFTIWTFGGSYVIAAVAWLVAGEEVIVAGPTELSIRQQALGFGKTKHYEASRIRALRALTEPIVSQDRLSSLRDIGTSVGSIVFNYDSQIVAFGHSLDESEALSIAEHLRERYPA